MAEQEKVTLLIPTLNEIGGMKQIMPRIKKEWYDQIIIVDGGSDDGTVEYAKEQGYFVFRQKKKGIRHAYTEALSHARGEIIIPFSPDGNSIPEVIPVLVKKIKEGYDMVIASRYLGGAKSYDDDFFTSLGNRIFIFLINFFFKARYTDVMIMYRAWRKKIFYDLELDKDESYYLEEKICNTIVGIEPLLTIRAAKQKLKCAEIPADEPARIYGKRKLIFVKWGLAYLLEIIKEIFSWR